MAKIERLEGVIAALKDREKKADEANVSVAVVYTAEYAIYVHENLQAHHRVGQAKFLEQPAREFQWEIGKLVADALKAGRTMLQALTVGALRLLRESKKLVPVATGNLKNSGTIRVDSDGKS